MAEQLDPLLQCITELRFAMKTAHWNIRGENFIGVHKLFDKVEGSLNEHLDQIGERLKVLGGMPRLSVRAMTTPMHEELPSSTNGEELVAAVLKLLMIHNAHLTYAARVADKIVDLPSMDLLIKQSSTIEHYCYILGQHLPPQVMATIVGDAQAYIKAAPRTAEKAKSAAPSNEPTNEPSA